MMLDELGQGELVCVEYPTNIANFGPFVQGSELIVRNLMDISIILTSDINNPSESFIQPSLFV